MEYCGIDLHDRNSEVCILDEAGEVMERVRVSTTRAALRRFFGRRERMRVAMEATPNADELQMRLKKLA